MKINRLACCIVIMIVSIFLIICHFNNIIAKSKKKIQDLEHKNELLKIEIDTNDKILKKQANIIKHINELLLQKQKDDEQIQTDKLQNQITLDYANSLRKKQELLNRIFYETDK